MNENTFDLIVVGAGMAGHCTALAAAEAGASVLLLEKTEAYGGSTAMCGGAFAFAGTDMQKAKGIADSPALLEEDLMVAGRHRNDRSLVHEYAERQLDAYAWLKGLGVQFQSVSLSGSQSVPRNHSANPRDVLALLHRHVLGSGKVVFRTHAVAQRLLTAPASTKPDDDGRDSDLHDARATRTGEDDSARRITGIELASGERVLARGGVVLATGGFSRAADLVERFVPHLRAARPMGGAGNTGDGLRMAWALGADMVDLGYVKGTFGAPVRDPLPGHEHTAPRIVSAMYRGAIVVNTAGRRFVDESVSYKVIGDACLLQPEARAFQVFDSQVMAQSSPLPSVADYRGALAAGLVVQADTLDQLAARLGIEPQGLADTVARYNAVIDADDPANQPDEFGRRSLSTGYGKPTRVEQGPFYGIACTTGLTSTFSGLRTDVRARVFDVAGRVIDGLYAVGEIIGGFHGETYMSGSSLGKGCVFGRIAAVDAAGRARARHATNPTLDKETA